MWDRTAWQEITSIKITQRWGRGGGPDIALARIETRFDVQDLWLTLGAPVPVSISSKRRQVNWSLGWESGRPGAFPSLAGAWMWSWVCSLSTDFTSVVLKSNLGIIVSVLDFLEC